MKPLISQEVVLVRVGSALPGGADPTLLYPDETYPYEQKTTFVLGYPVCVTRRLLASLLPQAFNSL